MSWHALCNFVNPKVLPTSHIIYTIILTNWVLNSFNICTLFYTRKSEEGFRLKNLFVSFSGPLVILPIYKQYFIHSSRNVSSSLSVYTL